MRGLQVVPYGTKIDFIAKRWLAYGVTLIILAASVVSLSTRGLNLGIDFRGGLLFEIRTPDTPDLASLRKTVGSLGLGDVKLQEFGEERDVMIRVERQPGGDAAQVHAQKTLKKALGTDVEYRRIESVGPKVSKDLIFNGMWAFGFALIGMLFYIWFRFEWQFGLCGVLALLHDSIAVIGFYSLSGLEFNETAFAAILTTVGYSINDSVVIYDRIRENLRKYKKTPLPEVFNLSVNETLSRTILTSGTTLFALGVLYWLGGSVIEAFSLPILVGVLVGTFSSIFLSVALLLNFDLRAHFQKKEEENALVKNSS